MRPELGDFSSIACFKAVMTGVEDTLGNEGAAVVFTRSGKARGELITNKLGLAGTKLTSSQLAAALNHALGKNGTKLCSIFGVRQEGKSILIDVNETICSTGEPSNSDRRCTYTLGVIWGALENIMEKRYYAKQVAFVPKGDAHDAFEFSPVA